MLLGYDGWCMPACKMQEINAAPINGFDLGERQIGACPMLF